MVFFFTDLFIDYHLESLHSSVINHPSKCKSFGVFSQICPFFQAGFHSIDTTKICSYLIGNLDLLCMNTLCAVPVEKNAM